MWTVSYVKQNGRTYVHHYSIEGFDAAKAMLRFAFAQGYRGVSLSTGMGY